MSDEMEVAPDGQNENRKDSTEEMELEADLDNGIKQLKNDESFDVADSGLKNSQKYSADTLLKLSIPNAQATESKWNREGETSRLESDSSTHKNNDCKLSPPVLVHSQLFENNASDANDSPFQKPTVCRTHSLGASDPSPFTIRRRPGRLAFANPLQSPSAFKRKLQMGSPIRFDVLDEMEDSALKRCNSAPMLNEINDIDARMSWHHGSITPGSVRARRFSATVLSSPSAGSSKSTSRLHQLKKEESLEGIQHKETAHEREVQTSIQMYHTCEELSLSDGLNGSISGPAATNDASVPRTQVPADLPPRSPLPITAPVSIPVSSKQSSTRAIDFTLSNPPHHNHHSSGGSIPSPLTISTGPLSLSPLPPSPTRNLGFSSTGKQCFSPSMQVPVPAPSYLRPGSLSPSPSPTRRTFVTRRRSQSPCVLKPSALGPIKRKYDSDSEGGCSPKRMFIPGSQTPGGAVGGQSQGDSFPYHIVMPHFSRNSIHRSHSLSSSSVDSDINVSPSPPQNGVNIGFLPSTHQIGVINNPHQPRETNSGSLFQSPLQSNPYTTTGGAQELTRCSSPASSTCSSSSLEGLKDLPPFAQNHLSAHSSNNSTPTLIKQNKERQSSGSSGPASTANVTL